jgi:hypothetical protein
MTLLQGFVIAVTACAVTLLVFSAIAVAIAARRIQEERRCNGCSRGGCRRSRGAAGSRCNVQPGGDGTPLGDCVTLARVGWVEDQGVKE